MNVSLTPELRSLINEKVKSGMYHSASEVVREALRLLKEQDVIRQMRLEELRREVDLGIAQLENGEYTTYASAAEFGETIKAEARRQIKKQADK